jgi:putative endonuclease
MERAYWVYILASRQNGTFYVGVTSNLARRVYQHREGLIPGFTTDHGVKRLVWYEGLPTALEAIAAEKRIKRWRRRWKLELIERMNPEWEDLYLTLNGCPTAETSVEAAVSPGSRLSAALRPG